MSIPTECKMPDLTGLDSPLFNRLFVKLLIGERNISRKASLYRRNFIRLIDKALREYDEARNIVLAEIAEANRPAEEMAKTGRHIYIYSFTDHIETCINAVSRLFRLLDRISSEKDSPVFPRSLRKLLQAKNQSIKDIRNSVEHIDEYIQKDEIAPGNPIMLTLNEETDGVVVSKFEIKFEELAIVLKNINEIAAYLLELKTVSTKNHS
jgi:hypothetical protein